MGYVAGGRFEVEVTFDALEHIRQLPRKHHRLVFQTLRRNLSTEPFKEARHRKPLVLPAPFDAHWELRFGPSNRYRAFYRAQRATILVVALGVKQRERLFIGGQEVYREARIHRRGQGSAE